MVSWSHGYFGFLKILPPLTYSCGFMVPWSCGLVVSWWQQEMFSWYNESSNGLVVNLDLYHLLPPPFSWSRGLVVSWSRGLMVTPRDLLLVQWKFSWSHCKSRILSSTPTPLLRVSWSRGLMVPPWDVLLVQWEFSWSHCDSRIIFNLLPPPLLMVSWSHGETMRCSLGTMRILLVSLWI